MADLAPVEVGSQAVNISTGLEVGTDYICFVQGPSVRLVNAQNAPDRNTQEGRVYGNAENLTPYVVVTPEDGSTVWAFQVSSTEDQPTILSRATLGDS